MSAFQSSAPLETPPPSYNEVIGKAKHPRQDVEVNYLNAYSAFTGNSYNPPMSSTQFEAVPLQHGIINSPNACSPNFREVQPSVYKKVLKWAAIGTLVVVVCVLTAMFGTRSKRH